MNLMNAGVQRSLLVGDVAKMQVEDAAEAMVKRSRVIDWTPTGGCEMFYGPLPEGLDVSSFTVESHHAGLAHRAMQRLNMLMHRTTKTA